MRHTILLLIFCSTLCFGQQQKIDSLNNLIPTITDKTEQAESKLELAKLNKNKDRILAIKLAQEVLYFSKETRNIQLIRKAHFRLSSLYYYDKQDSESLKHIISLDSISQAETIKDELLINAKIFQANISKFTFTPEGVAQAKKYMLEGLELAKEIENEEQEYKVTYNLGELHGFMSQFGNKQERLDSAEMYFKRVLPYFQKKKDFAAEANTYYSLASVALSGETEDYKTAESYYQKRIKLIKQTTDSARIAEAYFSFANLFRKLDQPERGLKYMDSARNIFTSTGFPSKVRKKDMYKDYAYLFEVNGDYKNAFLNIQEALVLKDSIYKEQNNKSTIEAEAKFQNEKKEQEIALLTAQNKLAEETKKNQRNVLLGGLILTTLAGIFFFIQYRNRQKTAKKLQELDVAKSTFFANISHEFRTPLTLIKGPIEDQLNKTEPSSSNRRNLLVAKNNTTRLESLVDQLLALSKLESGNLKLQVQPNTISGFMDGQASAFHFAMEEKNINYTSQFEKSNNEQWFDHDVLEKIMTNLIGNALKYTPENGEIRVAGKLEGDLYKFSVSNSGETLNLDEQKDIFKRFYQSNPNNPGTGIGLALTKELAELHKGSIAVASNDGATKFTVEIRVNESAFNQDEILSEVLRNQFSTSTNISEERIEENLTTLGEDAPILLIVDDNTDIRNYIASIFESTYKIQTAANGREGFDKILEQVPDVIISDVMMPEVDGFTLTEMVKTNELASHIPIVLLTAKTEDADKLKGIETGADAYLTKPFNSKLLVATIQNLLDNRRKLQDRFAQEVILQPKKIAVSSTDEKFLERLQSVLENHLTNPSFSAVPFSEEMGVSRMQLHRKLKALTGQSTTEFLKSQRLRAALQLVKKEDISISEIGYAVGFNDPSYFTKCFKQEFGVSPTEYSKK